MEPDESDIKLRQEQLGQKIAKEHLSLETLKAKVVQVLQDTSAFGSVLIRVLIQQSESK